MAFNPDTHGHLAYVYCGLLLPLQVLRSNAGYYIGTINEGMPCSRESTYYPTEELAQSALTNHSFIQRSNP